MMRCFESATPWRGWQKDNYLEKLKDDTNIINAYYSIGI